jgi:hypothetical protein
LAQFEAAIELEEEEPKWTSRSEYIWQECQLTSVKLGGWNKAALFEHTGWCLVAQPPCRPKMVTGTPLQASRPEYYLND